VRGNRDEQAWQERRRFSPDPALALAPVLDPAIRRPARGPRRCRWYDVDLTVPSASRSSHRRDPSARRPRGPCSR
jgi:hypothetical protein